MLELGWIDSHAHLTASEYDEDFDQVVANAKDAGVSKILLICCSLPEATRALELARNDTYFDVAVGFHPENIHEYTEADWNKLEKIGQDERVVAIGEIGLDYYWKQDDKEFQRACFIRQIELANRLQKPILIHSRDAHQDTYETLIAHPPIHKGILHCYSGSSEMAKKYLDLGMYISLAGPVTFKNAVQPKENAIIIPLDRLFIETDCPYLTPHPLRGKRNEPAYIQYTAQLICELKQVSEDELQTALSENYITLFCK